MKKKKKEAMYLSIIAIIITLATILLSSSCSIDTNGTPPCINPLDTEKSGRLLNHTDCKNTGGVIAGDILPSDECISFVYYPNQNAMLLTHSNAGFNCCPEKISSVIIFQGNNIKITEKQAKTGCKCECLYDVIYELRNIKPGIYCVEIFGPITDGTNLPPLSFDIDVEKNKDSVFCLYRGFYPWQE